MAKRWSVEPFRTVSTFRTPPDSCRGDVSWSQTSNPHPYLTAFIALQDTPVRGGWPGTARTPRTPRSQTKTHHSHAQSVAHALVELCDRHRQTLTGHTGRNLLSSDSSYPWTPTSMVLTHARETCTVTSSLITLLVKFIPSSPRRVAQMTCVQGLMSSLTDILSGRRLREVPHDALSVRTQSRHTCHARS
jgi:hypothetical protein